MKQEWIVKWENGKTLTFIPMDSIGMTSFIKQGLANGKVFVNDKEVIMLNDDLPVYREDCGFITKKRYDKLLDDEAKLLALEMHGVSTWELYDHCIEDYDLLKKEK